MIFVEELQTKNDHGAFKNPLPNYEKGEYSSSNNKGKNINYVYDTTILHIEVVNDSTHEKLDTIVNDNPTNDDTIGHEQNIIEIENHHHNVDTTSHQINVIKIKEQQDNTPVKAIT